MSDQDALIAGCLVNPRDKAPFLVYADWLEDRGHDLHARVVRCLTDYYWHQGRLYVHENGWSVETHLAHHFQRCSVLPGGSGTLVPNGDYYSVIPCVLDDGVSARPSAPTRREIEQLIFRLILTGPIFSSFSLD